MEHAPIRAKHLVLFALWERAEGLALGGIKFGYECIRRFKFVQPLCLTTQRLGFSDELSIGDFTRFSRQPARRLFYYILLAKLILTSLRIVRRECVYGVMSFGVGWVNDLAALAVSKLTRRKLFLVFHHWPYRGYDFRSILRSMRAEGRGLVAAVLASVDRALARRALLHATRIFTVSETSKQELMRMGIPEEKIVVVYPGVDEVFFSCEAADKTVDAVSAVRMSLEKGIFDLIEIWSRVVAERPGSKLYVTGHPTPVLSAWQQKVKESGLQDSVTYLGVVSRKEQVELMQKAKVFVFPSHKEGFGIAVAEAMACGLPVVCYDIEPMNKVFNSGGVFYVPEGDVQSFAKKVLELLEDDGLRREAGRVNRAYAQRFTWDNTARRIESETLNS